MKSLIQKPRFMIITLLAILVVAIGVFFAIPDEYKVFPKTSKIEIELGTQPDGDISTYIWGMKSIVREAQLDFSEVDVLTAGDYQMHVKIGSRIIPFDLEVIDTVAPCISVNQEMKYVATEWVYDACYFVSEVTDLSDTSEVYFKVDGTLQNTISFDAPGEHTLALVAKDISGNESEQTITVIADMPEIELGTQLDTDAPSYILSIKSVTNEVELDFSDVDIFTAGDYQIYATIDEHSISYDLKVVDTVAPYISVNREIEYVATEREYDAYHFISEVTDLSDTSEVYFKIDDTLQNTISFDTPGEYTLTFVARDISGNESEQSTTVTADIAPRFMGLTDMTIPVGADFDYSQGFVVFDATDGFITDTVTISAENVDFSQEGTYEITYSVVNSKGIDNHKTITVTTAKNATNDYKYNTNLTDDDWNILIDNGYFTYELLDETNEDHNATIDLVKPISLNISKDGYMGSAFIYKIEEDYIYATSVRHAMVAINGNIDMVFYNDQVINTYIEYEALKNTTDLAIFRFKTSDVPKELLYTLKQAYIDNEYYSQLTTNEPLIEYSENHDHPLYTNQKIKLVKLVATYANADFMPYTDTMTTTTRGARSGMSGCPVIDYQGRVIGATSYISNLTNLDYIVRLDRIDEFETNLREND